MSLGINLFLLDIYIYIYLSGKINVCRNLQNAGEAYKAVFLGSDVVCTYTTFYDASIGEVRFDGTFRMSELEGVGLRSDFQIFGGQFRKTYGSKRNYMNNKNVQSDNQKTTLPHRYNLSKRC